ncbi:centromere DNA-binding protein complex CBF3 subunit [Apiospora arundinis]
MPSRPKPHEDAWKRPAKFAATIDKLLFELQDCQPKNTTKTYAPKQREWLASERRRREVGTIASKLADDSDTEGGDFSHSNLRLRYNTVWSYISAIQRLYEEQRSRRINPAPPPQGIPFHALKSRIIRVAYAQSRTEMDDRGEGTLKDAYTIAHIHQHTAAVWQERKAIACALRTQVDFLLGNHMLLRSSNRLPIELPDCFCLVLPNEGIQRASSSPAAKALVILMRQGKTNQHGRMEYGAALRHRDPNACLSLSDPTSPLSPQTANVWTRKLYERCGIQTSKASYAPRIASSQNADFAGVPDASIRRAGRWNNGDQMTGCYLTSLPRQFMRSTADFDPEWAGSYYVPRSSASPPASLLTAVWPELDHWQQKYSSGALEQNKAAGAFLELLQWLRAVLLQDAPFLMDEFPDHPLFQQPVFQRIDFTVFAACVRDACRQSRVDTHSEIIQKAIPAVAEKLRAVATQQIAAEKSVQQLTTEVRRLEDEVHHLRNLSWRVTMDITPNERELIQVHQFEHRRGPETQDQNRPQQPLASTCAQSSEHRGAQPPQFRLPRTTKSIVDLLRIWRTGLPGMPSIDTLEARWGARWRPLSEKAFFSKRKIIIDEIGRKAGATKRTEEVVAQQMDAERGTASLDKVIKILRTRRSQQQSIPLAAVDLGDTTRPTSTAVVSSPVPGPLVGNPLEPAAPVAPISCPEQMNVDVDCIVVATPTSG